MSDNMSDMLPEDYYYEQDRLEEFEKEQERRLNECNHHMLIEEVSKVWEHGIARYFAIWSCGECMVYDKHVISHDDYLHWKNKGY